MSRRISEGIWIGTIVSLLLLLLILTHGLSPGVTVGGSGSGREWGPSSNATSVQKANESLAKIRRKRQSVEGLIDPYSILGLLSFGTFVLTVLYSQYKMKSPGSSPNKSAPSASGKPSGSTKLGSLSQETIEQIMKVATKFLKDSQAKTRNSTIMSEDYYDTDFEKRADTAGSV